MGQNCRVARWEGRAVRAAGGNFNLDWVAEGTGEGTNLPSRLANMR